MHKTSSRPWSQTGLPPELSQARPWIRGLARYGFWAQGCIHFVVGVLAVQLAAGLGGETESLHSALAAIHQHAFGGTLLIILGLGFASFAAWKFVQAIWDPDGIGRTWFALAIRAGFAGGGMIYLGLAYSAMHAVVAGGAAGREEENRQIQSATATALSQPLGRWLLGLLVVILLGFAIGNFAHAVRARFRDQLAADRMHRGTEIAVTSLGRAAYAARGLVFLAAAWLFVRAALLVDPQAAGGMADAMALLLQQPFGRLLLGAAGAGFIAYALFSWLLMRYRRLPA